MFQDTHHSRREEGPRKASDSPGIAPEDSPANQSVPSFQVARFSLKDCASFIASDHIAEESLKKHAPAVFRHLAEHLRQQESVHTAALRKAYSRILSGKQGEVAESLGIAVHAPEERTAFHAKLNWRSTLSIRFMSEASLRESLASVLEATAARIEQGDIETPGHYCYQSDAVVVALSTPDTYLNNPYA